MNLFNCAGLAACCLLALPSFAFMPATSARNETAARTAAARASLKVQSITTTITTTLDEEGNLKETEVTKIECSGPAYDCRVNSSGGAEYVTPTGL